MTQYLMSVLSETGELATAEEMAAIDVFNEQLQADGHWVFANGLAAPGTATVVDGRDGEPCSPTGRPHRCPRHPGHRLVAGRRAL